MFVPGSLAEPAGEPFAVSVAPFRLATPRSSAESYASSHAGPVAGSACKSGDVNIYL
jgi:hypothetical protein